tara:strand:+ start:760 stop:1011 length:252 start_codon:yes stop_codon:yes gene_type:complete
MAYDSDGKAARDLARWQGEISSDVKNIGRSVKALEATNREMMRELREMREEWAGVKGMASGAGAVAALLVSGAVWALDRLVGG